MKKKMLAMLLAALMVVSLLPVTAFAVDPCPDGTHDWSSGTCEVCGTVCAHSSGYFAGNCKTCGVACTHSSGYSGGGFNKAGQCNTCKLYCNHEGTTKTVQVTNCKNDSGKKYGRTTCECGYTTQGVLGDGVDHVFTESGNCANCGQSHTHNFGTGGKCQTDGCDVVHTQHSFDTTGKCTTQGCSAECAHSTTETIYTCKGTYETVRCQLCKHVISSTNKGSAGPHSYGEDGKCIHCGNPQPCETHTWDKTERTGECTECGADCPHTSYSPIAYTCGQGGYVTEECDTCGKTRATTTQIPANHSYENGECIHCGEDEPATPCEHEWADPNGLDAGQCTLCPASCEHPNGTVLSYGNCITSDYDTERCKVCQKALNHIAHDRGRHSWEDGECAVCGVDEFHCDHEWDWATGKCKKEGCGEECPHEYMTTLHPDCTEGGYIRHKCAQCGWITVENTPFEPGEHDYENGVCTRCGHVKPGTSTEKASTEGLDYVPKTGNILIEWLYALIFG